MEAKGKGSMQTYWCELRSDSFGGSNSGSSKRGESDGPELAPKCATLINKVAMHNGQQLNAADEVTTYDFQKLRLSNAAEKIQKLVDWNSTLLLQLLRNVVAHRSVVQENSILRQATLDVMATKLGDEFMVVDEVAEIIAIPAFSSGQTAREVVICSEVVKQLHDFVAKIASMYNDNPCKLNRSIGYHDNVLTINGIDLPNSVINFLHFIVHNFEHVRRL